MPAPRIRADHDALKQIAQSFERQADATRQAQERIKQALETLRGGDWIGKGATAFYQEMDSAVMPALRRLISALEQAQRIIQQISQIMQQAENEAANIFVIVAGAGTGAGAPGSAGGLGGSGGSSGGSASGGGSSSGGSASGGGSSGGGGSSSGGSAPGGGGSSGGGSAGAQTATDRMLSRLDPRVRELAQRSPTLRAQLERLEREGWTIQTRSSGGSETDSQNKRIIIDTSNSSEYQVGSVAHEAAHALYGQRPYHAPTPTMNRDEYVRLNVQEHLRDEGNAQFNRANVRQEILDGGGPDIRMSGNQHAEYLRIYGEYRTGTITRAQAVEQIGNAVGNDVTGTTNQNYRQYYGQTYEQFWDRHIAPSRRTP